MRVRFIGDVEYYGIPWGTEFSIAIAEIQETYVNVDYFGEEFSVDTVSLVAVAPETIEDTLFLQRLRADILSHSKILLGNVDQSVHFEVPNNELGFWLFENEKWSYDDNAYVGGRYFWHYLVSEIVKDEGIAYYEAKPVCKDGKQLSNIGIFFCEDGNECLLKTFGSVAYNNEFATFTTWIMEKEK